MPNSDKTNSDNNRTQYKEAPHPDVFQETDAYQKRTLVDETVNNDAMYGLNQSVVAKSDYTSTGLISSHPSHLSEKEINSLIRYNHMTYLLYVLSFFTAGIIWAVPIIMNYGRRNEATGTWLATHFDWQIKTFWYSIIAVVIGIVIISFSLMGLGIGVLSESSNMAIGSFGIASIGWLLILWAVIWHFYRIIRGWIALSDKKPIQ